MEKIPLSPKDKAELKDIMISNTGACLLVMAILTGIYVVILKIDSDYFWIFHTIIWAIYLFFTYLIWTCWKDWKADYKWQKSGEIQDKKIKHSGGSSSTIGGTYAGGRMSSSSSSSISSSTTIYRFKIDNKWLTVPFEIYQKYPKGTIFHYYITAYTHYFISES